MTTLADKAVVVGVGLIGASLAGGMRSRGLAARVVGVGRGKANLDTALARGFVDEATSDLHAAVDGADLVILAAPVDSCRSLLRSLVALMPHGCTVTDAGSVKAAMQATAAELGLARRFVGAHPMAGGTSTGAAAADGDLFVGCTTVVTPEVADRERVELVASLWSALGAKVVEMKSSEHDRIVARASHLPQMLSYALATALSRTDAAEIIGLAGGGLRDTTRLAASDAAMWTAIAAENKAELLRAMDELAAVWAELRDAVDGGDVDALRGIIRSANAFRRDLESK